jgi:hypothetical protein
VKTKTNPPPSNHTAHCSPSYAFYVCYVCDRILGCLPRKDCQALRELFDENRNEFGHGKTLAEILQEVRSCRRHTLLNMKIS